MFFSFTLLSGLGWVCDFVTFTLLVNLSNLEIFKANFVSSYVGVTFVWFTSLKTVFKLGGKGSSIFLVVYWCFQFVSILIYSQLMHMTVHEIPSIFQLVKISQNPEIAAKIIITPFNLVTNFIFMKFLTHLFAQKALRP
ncbi:GtrA family protein [Limnohabitans sp. T6-20]|uniref:GtrA family protein n=1 Tax=Limnohabitans sp. T6-20 TaxID=1100725 RepID=UPI003511CA29